MSEPPGEQRDRVIASARDDTATAEAAAHRIEDPWYRAQALAWTLRYAPDGDIARLTRDTMDAASSCDDPYQQVAASAWLLRALLERDHRDEALTMLEIVMHAVPRIASATRRGEALFAIYQAVFETGAEIRRGLLFALAEVFDASDHWRVTRIFRDALVMAKAHDRDYVDTLARAADDAWRPALQDALADDQVEPRVFFW